MAGRQTQHKIRILANNQYVVRLDEGGAANQALSKHSDAALTLLAHLETLYARCDAVIISDYCYGTITDELLASYRTCTRATRSPCSLTLKLSGASAPSRLRSLHPIR